jgi:integrase
LCLAHRRLWLGDGRPSGAELDGWLDGVVFESRSGEVSLADLAPLLAAEIRYGLWAHTKATRPARWHPMWLRTLVRSCAAAGVGSLLELDPDDSGWTPQPKHVNRIVRELRKDIEVVHRSRSDTRELGYIDPNYWGFRFPNRRSVFDLTAISQRWLRDITWDYLANVLDGPRRPRTAGTFEEIRRSVVCFSAFLTDCDPGLGASPATLTENTAREFVADFARRVTNHQPVRGVFNVDGSSSPAKQISYALSMNALRRVMRWALDTGTAAAIELPREFIVAVPTGGALSHKNPRPFSDAVLRALSDPANIALLDDLDPHDTGLADIWSIQVRCGRRISEIVQLRWDCVAEHLGRTWMWLDMTKVGKLDYAIQIPRDVYDTVGARQTKTVERFRLKHGTGPTAAQRRTIALFPSRVANPAFERSVSTPRFTQVFKRWIESEAMKLPGHTTHQARHTLATRLVNAGASMAHVKRILGHVSERMSESYVLVAGSQVEPFLHQVWVTGPGNPEPGQVVLTPTEDETAAARDLLVDLAAIPTEHGLCTFKPVVGGVDCPFGRDCHNCEHFVLTGADYGYWKRQEQRWAALAEGTPDTTTRDYIYTAFEKSSQALAGLEKALVALGLLDDAKQLDLRSPHQDFFDPIWTQGWRTGDLVRIGTEHDNPEHLTQAGDDEERAAS